MIISITLLTDCLHAKFLRYLEVPLNDTFRDRSIIIIKGTLL